MFYTSCKVSIDETPKAVAPLPKTGIFFSRAVRSLFLVDDKGYISIGNSGWSRTDSSTYTVDYFRQHKSDYEEILDGRSVTIAVSQKG